MEFINIYGCNAHLIRNNDLSTFNLRREDMHDIYVEEFETPDSLARALAEECDYAHKLLRFFIYRNLTVRDVMSRPHDFEWLCNGPYAAAQSINTFQEMNPFLVPGAARVFLATVAEKSCGHLKLLKDAIQAVDPSGI